MKRLLAALLLAPGLATAACFTHPDTGRLHCSSGNDCPQPSTWDSRTLACVPPSLPPVTPGAPSCSGVDSGTYTPAGGQTFNVTYLEPRQAFWTRVSAIVTVSGSVWLVAGGAELLFNLSPPIATRFEDTDGLSGTMAVVHQAQARGVGSVPDTGMARFFLTGQVDGANVNVRYTYTYRIAECP